MFTRLGSTLPDEPDAGIVFQAAAHGVRYVIPLDTRTMRKHAAAVASLCDVAIVKPSEFVEIMRGTTIALAP